MKKLYKVLHNNKSCSGGNFDWTPYLPDGDNPGKWTPNIEPDLCASGYHGTDAAHLLDFVDGNQLFEIECIDETWDSENKKFVSSSIRLVRQIEGWNEKNLRLFAVWCAHQVEYLITDERSKNAINVSERFANGEATAEELASAWDAASDAAWAAARAAWAAARAAARAAAKDAAKDAAWASAGAAVWAAARAAAWASAGAAAGDAAWASAGAAAGDAAWASARDAQYKKLYEMIGIEVKL